jgi:hypothetical protein
MMMIVRMNHEVGVLPAVADVPRHAVDDVLDGGLLTALKGVALTIKNMKHSELTSPKQARSNPAVKPAIAPVASVN